MHKTLHPLLVLGALTVSVTLAAQAGPDVVIPAVSSYTLKSGSFTLEDGAAPTVRIGDRKFRDKTPGAYALSVTPKGVTIRAADDLGVFYAKHSPAARSPTGPVTPTAA